MCIRDSNKITPALSCNVIMVTDKNGDVISDSVLSVRDNGGKLRDIIRITKGMPLYKLVEESGLDWSDDIVVEALNAWTTSTIEQMDYVKNLDCLLYTSEKKQRKKRIFPHTPIL